MICETSDITKENTTIPLNNCGCFLFEYVVAKLFILVEFYFPRDDGLAGKMNNWIPVGFFVLLSSSETDCVHQGLKPLIASFISLLKSKFHEKFRFWSTMRINVDVKNLAKAKLISIISSTIKHWIDLKDLHTTAISIQNNKQTYHFLFLRINMIKASNLAWTFNLIFECC